MVYSKEYQQKYAELNRDKINARARTYYRSRAAKDPLYVRNRQRKKKDIKKFVDALKAMFGCSRCPERDPACLDFHHVDDKKFSVASMCNRNRNIADIIDEMLKCIVLCANCHRKEHAKKNGQFSNPVYQCILDEVKNFYSSCN